MTKIRVRAAGEPGPLSAMFAQAMDDLKAFDRTAVPEGWTVSRTFRNGHPMDPDTSKLTVSVLPTGDPEYIDRR